MPPFSSFRYFFAADYFACHDADNAGATDAQPLMHLLLLFRA